MMIAFARSRFAVCAGATIALLAGCGGAQPPIGAPSMMPQSSARHSSASGGDLLYFADAARGRGTKAGITIYSYPTLKKVGDIPDVVGYGLCSDQQGNVFVPDGSSTIYEYAHGGTQPIATLSEYSDDLSIGCSVDPTTGNLAVTNNDGNNFYNCIGQGNVAIFAGGQGIPTTYCTGPAVKYAYACGYDNKGNLYVDGGSTVGANGGAVKFAVLPKGSDTFKAIKLDRSLRYPRAVQWNGSNMTIETAGGKTVPTIYEVQVSGRMGRIVHETHFKDITSGGAFGLSWIQDKSIVVPGRGSLGLFRYPAGGKATHTLNHNISKRPLSVTVSVAASE
jgi:hypothetical protein